MNVFLLLIVNVKLTSAVSGNCWQNTSRENSGLTGDIKLISIPQNKQHHNRTNGTDEPHSV